MAYLTLKGEMAKNDITAESIAKCLGIHRNSVTNKLKGVTSFSIEEALLVRNVYFPDQDIEVLFKKD